MKKIMMIFLVLIALTGCKPSNNAPLAYAPIRLEETAAAFVEKDDVLTEESFQDVSNSIRVLHNCGFVPYSRIESVKAITEDTYIRDNPSYLFYLYELQCSCGNALFTIECGAYKEPSLYRGQLYLVRVYSDQVTENSIVFERKPRRTGEDIQELLEARRQRSLTLLKDYCGITEKEANGLMEEIDLLYQAKVIDLYDIKSIEQSKRNRDTISLSLTSDSGDPYTVFISTVNRPIILSITDSNGLVLYTSNER